jgi:hypothetical protein
MCDEPGSAGELRAGAGGSGPSAQQFQLPCLSRCNPESPHPWFPAVGRILRWGGNTELPATSVCSIA